VLARAVWKQPPASEAADELMANLSEARKLSEDELRRLAAGGTN
jgi:hypothetical protein